MYSCLLVSGAPAPRPLNSPPSTGCCDSVTVMEGGAVGGGACMGGAVSCSCVGVPVVVTTVGLLVRCGSGDDVEVVGREGRGAAGTLSYPGLPEIDNKYKFINVILMLLYIHRHIHSYIIF